MTGGLPAPTDLLARLHAERDSLAEQLADTRKLLAVAEDLAAMFMHDNERLRQSAASDGAAQRMDARPRLRLVAGGRT